MVLRMIVAALAVVMGGCASVNESTRIAPGLKAVEFNRVAAQYLERPTFAELNRYSDGREALVLVMDKYGQKRSAVAFLRGSEAAYDELLKKFLDWEVLARERGDQFTREIGRAPTWSQAGTAELRFTFHSGNQALHYPELVPCLIGTCLEESGMHLTPENVRKLRELVADLREGKVKQKDLGTVYK
jgi:hypothetical protein